MRKFIDTIQDHRGNGIVGATVVIRNFPTNTLAAIYSDNGITPIADSTLQTDSRGAYEFYVANGRYTFEISGEGISNRRVEDIVINDSSIATLDGTGYIVANGDGTYQARSLLSGSTSLSIQNSNGVAGNSVFVMHPNLDELAALPGGITSIIPDSLEIVALEDAQSQTVAITAGTEKDVLEAFPGCEILRIWAALKEPSTSGSVIIDVNVNGVSVMTTNKLRMDQGDRSTFQSTQQPVLTTTIIPPFARVTVDYDQAGVGAKGVVVWMAVVIDDIAVLATVYNPEYMEWMPRGAWQPRRERPRGTLMDRNPRPLV